MFEVRNSFMRRRVTVKSNDLRWDLFNGQTSRPYNRMGRHLLLTRCKKRSSDADRPILLNNALTDLKNERLAFSREHLQDLTSTTPRYLIQSTPRSGVLSSHKIAAQLASWRGPTRIQLIYLLTYLMAFLRWFVLSTVTKANRRAQQCTVEADIHVSPDVDCEVTDDVISAGSCRPSPRYCSATVGSFRRRDRLRSSLPVVSAMNKSMERPLGPHFVRSTTACDY